MIIKLKHFDWEKGQLGPNPDVAYRYDTDTTLFQLWHKHYGLMTDGWSPPPAHLQIRFNTMTTHDFACSFYEAKTPEVWYNIDKFTYEQAVTKATECLAAIEWRC
jgi:hypothetical protein